MSLFADWKKDVVEQDIAIRPDDINAEARGNLWTFALSSEELASVAAEEVLDFVRTIAAARSEWLAARRVAPMVLYCWFDGQAGQLRVSLVSLCHGTLPFECPVARVDDLGVVVREFLGTVVRVPSTPLPVWAVELPSASSASPR